MRITAKNLKAWLDLSVWICLQTCDAVFRLNMLAGKGCLEVPYDILEVFKRHGLVLENKERYFLESSPYGSPLLIELLPKEQTIPGLFFKVSEK